MKLPSLSILVSLLAAFPAFLAPGTAFALDTGSLHLIPWESAEFFIPDSEVGSRDPSSLATVVAEPSHGTLEVVGGGWIYRPAASFWASGIDSFRWTDTGQPTPGAPHYLIANLQREPWSAWSATGCLAQEPWSLVGDLSQGYMRVDADGVCRLRVDLGGSPLRRRSPPAETGPGGGNTTITLDTGDPRSDPNTNLGPLEIPVAGGYLVDGRPVFELVAGAKGEMFVRAHHDDGTFVSSSAVALSAGPRTVQLEWWFESSPGAADGGLILVEGAKPVAWVTGIANSGLLGQTWTWDIGTTEDTDHIEGRVVSSQVQVWTSPQTPILEPIVHRTASGLFLGLWDQLFTPEAVSLSSPPFGASVYRITAPAIGAAGLVDHSPVGERRYNARFLVDLGQVQTAGEPGWSLFLGHGDGTWPAPFIVQVRHLQNTGDTEIRAGANEGGAWRMSDWADLPTASGPLSMELHWWAARAPEIADGGLRLWIDREVPASIQRPPTIELGGLANSEEYIERTAFGILGVPPEMSGHLELHDFLAWR